MFVKDIQPQLMSYLSVLLNDRDDQLAFGTNTDRLDKKICLEKICYFEFPAGGCVSDLGCLIIPTPYVCKRTASTQLETPTNSSIRLSHMQVFASGTSTS